MDRRNRGWITVATFVLGLFAVLWLSVTDSRKIGSPMVERAPDLPKTAENANKPRPVVRESVGINVQMLAVEGEVVVRTPEQVRLAAFVDEVLTPLASEIASSYPIDSLRAEFRSVLINKVQMSWVLSNYVLSADVMARCVGPGAGHGEIEVYIPKMEREYRNLDRDTFTDIFVAVLLHEYRHFQTAGCSKDRARESADQNESETWWWECDHVFAQMRAHGRLQNLPPTNGSAHGLAAYDASHGDINAPEWKAFMDAKVNWRN